MFPTTQTPLLHASIIGLTLKPATPTKRVNEKAVIIEMEFLILVVEDVEEIRDGIQKLLKADGYQVAVAREPEEALMKIGQKLPDLMLVGLGMPITEVIQDLKAIRSRAGLDPEIPVVIFDFDALEEGEERAIEGNIYMTRPDNFNQLRALIRRLLN